MMMNIEPGPNGQGMAGPAHCCGPAPPPNLYYPKFSSADGRIDLSRARPWDAALDPPEARNSCRRRAQFDRSVAPQKKNPAAPGKGSEEGETGASGPGSHRPARPRASGGQRFFFAALIAAALACTGRRFAQAADIVLGELVGVRDELAAALAAGGQRHHAGVDEFDQPPGPSHRQQGFERLRASLFDVQLVGLDDRVDLFELGRLVQILVHVQEQGRVDVRLPGHEPVSRERQHAARRRFALHFLVQAQQPLVGQVGLRFQNLQASAQFDQGDRALDLAALADDAFDSHSGHPQLLSANCPAITMLACRPATAAPGASLAREWLVSRFQTTSSSKRKRRINWLLAAIFINWAGVNWSMMADTSSDTPRRYRAWARSARIMCWARTR